MKVLPKHLYYFLVVNILFYILGYCSPINIVSYLPIAFALLTFARFGLMSATTSWGMIEYVEAKYSGFFGKRTWYRAKGDYLFGSKKRLAELCEKDADFNAQLVKYKSAFTLTWVSFIAFPVNTILLFSILRIFFSSK